MCDYSGLIVQAEDRRKQMAYGGNGLYWTGLWVYKKFLDKPNPASQSPLIVLDPVIFPNPRPSEEVSGRQLQSFTIDTTGIASVSLDFGNVGYSPYLLTGTPSADPFWLYFPVVPGTWGVVNQMPVAAAYFAFESPIGPNNPGIGSLLPGEVITLYSDGVTLQTTPFEP